MSARQFGAGISGQQNESVGESKQTGPCLQTAQTDGNTDLTIMDESVRIKQEPNNQPSHECDGTKDVGQLVKLVDYAGVTRRSSLKKRGADVCETNIATLSAVVSCQQTQPPPQLQQQPSLEPLKTMAKEMDALLIKLTGTIKSVQDNMQMLRQELERAQLSLEGLKQMKKQMKAANTSPSDTRRISPVKTAVVSEHISCNTENSTKKITAKRSRQDVSVALIRSDVLQPSVTPPRPQVTASRLTDRHFIKKYERPRYKPDCKVCKATGKRRQTCMYCPDCNTPLCLTPCFKLYHTVEDYKYSRQRLL